MVCPYYSLDLNLAEMSRQIATFERERCKEALAFINYDNYYQDQEMLGCSSALDGSEASRENTEKKVIAASSRRHD